MINAIKAIWNSYWAAIEDLAEVLAIFGVVTTGLGLLFTALFLIVWLGQHSK